MKEIDILGKVVCVRNSNRSYINALTIGKIYNMYEKRYLRDKLVGYQIKNDNNIKCIYEHSFFKSIEDIRDEKLKFIGI